MQPQNQNPTPTSLPPTPPENPQIPEQQPASPPREPNVTPSVLPAQPLENPVNSTIKVPDEPPITTQLKSPSKLKGFLSFTLFIVGVLVTAFLINQFIFQSYFVDGTSMTPTLQNNDRLIIEKVSRSFSAIQGKPYIPNRGQIVVLDSSLVGVNGQEEQLIKRVIGLPGETIIIENNIVTIKNAASPQGFNVDVALGLVLEPTYSSERIEITVPENHVYVMGDNRAQGGSSDSRLFGPVAAEKLEGRLWARVLPIDQAELFSAVLGRRVTY